MEVGGIQCKILSKKLTGVIQCGHEKHCFSFWCGLPKWGSLSVQMCNFKLKLANFMAKLLNFTKCHAKICNLYIKFDTKVEKGGHWVWTE